MQTISVGSMFAGVGGICLGFLRADKRYKIAWANEIDHNACETYRKNFTHPLIEGDIYKLLNPNCAKFSEMEYYEWKRELILSSDIDILNGGFPCQAFSIAGSRKGFEDERGNLFLTIIELIHELEIRQKKPRILFLENVKNLLTHDNGRTYRTIKAKLQESGYTIKEQVLNTMRYSNLPQNRERLYILGFLNYEDSIKFTMFDRLKDFTTSEFVYGDKRVNDILDKEVSEKYYYTKEKYPLYYNDKINITRDIDEQGQFYQLRRSMYVRKNKSNVCPTLTANMGTGGHNVPLIKDNNGIRKLTPKETFRLQGFPIDNGYVLPEISDCNLYKQAGNSVSVPMIEKIAAELAKIL
jgi:DNA (cytosine-5)-methyltransferase 1